MSSPSLRGTLTYVHAFHGFLGAPEDWRPVAERLEADLQVLEAKAPVGLGSLVRPEQPQLDDSADLLSPIRLVAWDIESIFERHRCMTWGAWVDAFHRELLWRFPELAAGAGKPGRAAANGISPAKIRHALLGYSLGARLALPLLLTPPPAFADPETLPGVNEAGSRKRRLPRAFKSRVPWRRVVLVSAHPGLRTTQERSDRMASDLKWLERFGSRQPFERILKEWNAQPVLATSHSVPPSRKDLLRLAPGDPKRALFSNQIEHFSLGAQEDYRLALKSFGIENPDEPKILWVVGERDRKYVSVLHDLAESEIPGEYWMCSDAGHRVPWDNPVDFAARVRSFLA